MVKNGVVKPSKARKMRYEAPHHVRRRLLSAPLSPSLQTQHGTRTMSVIKDDTVTITKGDRKLTEGKVMRVDTKRGRVYIEGVTKTRLDGSTVQIPIRTENVMITKLKMDDNMRKRILERRAFSFKKES